VPGISERGRTMKAAANRDLASLQTIRRAPHAQRIPIQDVCVNHRRADIRMAEQFLNCSSVVPVLEQVRCKRMAERVTAGPFRSPRPGGPRR
jgi:hypothetical protein